MMQSPDPLKRAEGAVIVSATRDAKEVPALVSLLEDSDPGVRLYAIVSLQKLFGESFGYDYYAPADQREAAVARWREALRTGSLRIKSQAGTNARWDERIAGISAA